MKLSQKQFEELLKQNCLVLSLIGMSNIGKTYWSRQISGLGFKHINCDDLVEAKLGPVLKELGYSGIEDVSRWMGQPYDERFSVNQEKFLLLEKKTLQDIFSDIGTGENQHVIIDTTGSVVHTGKEYCEKLQNESFVVYIEATEDMEDEMFRKYIANPKPVVFGDIFVPEGDESSMQTLERCYRKLLNLRGALYTQYADVIIPREAIARDMDANQFMELIHHSL